MATNDHFDEARVTISRTRLGTIAMLVSGSLMLLLGLDRVNARQAVLVPNAENVRFQLIGNEPIAGPDGRALVKGWSVLMFKDRRSERCYIVFKNENGIAVEGGVACPR
jgi:hypothetical protein